RKFGRAAGAIMSAAEETVGGDPRRHAAHIGPDPGVARRAGRESILFGIAAGQASPPVAGAAPTLLAIYAGIPALQATPPRRPDGIKRAIRARRIPSCG